MGKQARTPQDGSPFDPQALERAVQRHLAMAPIPEDKRGAFLTVGNRDGVRAVIALRVGGHVEIGTFVEVARDPADQWGADYGVLIHGTF